MKQQLLALATFMAITAAPVSASAQLVIQIPEGMRQGQQALEQRVAPGCSTLTEELVDPLGSRTVRRKECSGDNPGGFDGASPSPSKNRSPS
jgi:hypothetical protein